MTERPSAKKGTTPKLQRKDVERSDPPAGSAEQAPDYGGDPPIDRNNRGGMTDAVDVAQNQMPGTPQDLAIDPQRPLEEQRRRAFDEMVAEHDRKDRDKQRQ